MSGYRTKIGAAAAAPIFIAEYHIHDYLEHLNSSSSHRLSTSFWNASIRYSFSGLSRCLNLPCGFKNSSIGSFFFGS